MAYADEALDASAKAAVARYLAQNAEAAAIVLMYRHTAVLLRTAFERPMCEPAIDHLPAPAKTRWWRRMWTAESSGAARLLGRRLQVAIDLQKRRKVT